MISAIVLAAGKSERMGKPKALLPFRGRTFLENILDTISRSTIENTIVVVGHHRQEIERTVKGFQLVFNPAYEQGMITSFQAGIRVLPWDAAGAFLFLVDHPLVEVETLERLIERLAPGRIIVPTYDGRRGHPVLFAPDILDEVLGLLPTEGANIVVRKDPTRVIEVPLNAPGILVDIDTPEQFEKLLTEEL
jgi:molybdenum cofactor cytidylyltransferase